MPDHPATIYVFTAHLVGQEPGMLCMPLPSGGVVPLVATTPDLLQVMRPFAMSVALKYAHEGMVVQLVQYAASAVLETLTPTPAEVLLLNTIPQGCA